MSKISLNRSFNAAKASKQDEFYTQLSDIEKELKHYKAHFKGKVVLCNCDDPSVSNFFHYFTHNFESLGLKKLITTCYKNNQPNMFSEHQSDKAVWLEYTGEKDGDRVPSPEEIGVKHLDGDGDFRSEECIELLKQADIVVTNPPFSLFREYVIQLEEMDKKFLVIANHNAITYKEIFKLIRKNKIWLGYSHPVAFRVPNNYEMRAVRSWRDKDGTNWRSLGNACWFTNLDIEKRHEELILYKSYDPEIYPEYDNYKAIEVSRYKEIPRDYDGVMGVPLTFLEKHNPEQFEIVGSDYEVKEGLLPQLLRADWDGKIDRGYVKGKRLYARILVRNKWQTR
ncbi:MAG TPA: adenine-specific methyltransferase EcoRI family protein [Pyrinomonadaceae bacterium]|nr:adenine-specific methyltransferase EcoRI family protein [Pyrinomonadaceae bacterium]